MMASFFSSARAIDLVVGVDARHRHIGGNVQHVELVDVHELGRFGQRRAGHARQLVVEAEIILEGDRGEGDVFGLDRDVFLGFQRLVQAFGIAPAFHHAAGEFVDDDDLVVLDDVVAVLLEQLVGLQRLVDVMDDGDVFDVVEIASARAGPRRAAAAPYARCRFGQRDLALLFRRVRNRRRPELAMRRPPRGTSRSGRRWGRR